MSASDPTNLSAARLRDAGWVVHGLRTGHFPMRSMPRQLAQLLERA